MKNNIFFRLGFSVVFLAIFTSCNNATNDKTINQKDSTIADTPSNKIAASKQTTIIPSVLELVNIEGDIWKCKVQYNTSFLCSTSHSTYETALVLDPQCTEESKEFNVNFSNYVEHEDAPPGEDFHTFKFNDGANLVSLFSVTVKPGRIPPPRSGEKLKLYKEFKKFLSSDYIQAIKFEYQINGNLIVTATLKSNMKFVFNQQDYNVGDLNYHILKLNIMPSPAALNTNSITITNFNKNYFIPFLMTNGNINLNLNDFNYSKQGAFKLNY